MGDERHVRWWQVGRRAFWTRPALLVVAALVGALALGALVYDEYLDLRADARLDRGCCLDQLRGVLDRDFAGRDFGQDFTVVAEDGSEHDIDVTFGASLRLDDFVGQEVTAYLADDLVGGPQVAAVRTPDGELVRAWGSRGRGITLTLALLGLGLSLVVGLAGSAVRKAAALRASGGARSVWGAWWRTGPVDFEPVLLVPAVLFVVGGVLFLGLAFGVPWWLLLAAPFLAAAVWWLRSLRPSGGRHVRSRPEPPG